MKTRISLLLAGALAFGTALSCARASTESVIYSFPDFSDPFPSLVEAKGGTLYGAAYGSGGTGLVYSLADKSRGWKYKTIHSFDISDGSGPSAALIEDPTSRTFYGVTAYGGVGFGTVFSLQRIGKFWL